MSDFVRPKRVLVSDKNYIEALVNANLQKDLHDDEEICEYCHGTGMVITDNPYGLSDDPDKKLGAFPYKHQSITFCPHCYNGIVHRCKFCGEIMPRGVLHHSCKQRVAFDLEEAARKERERFENATVLSESDAEMMKCFQSDYYPYNDGFFYDWDEFMDAYFDEHADDCVEDRPKYVWATTGEDFRINADDLVEQYSDDMYEDAADRVCKEDRKALQEFLDDWCKNCGIGTTYYIDYKHRVRIPWEDFK